MSMMRVVKVVPHVPFYKQPNCRVIRFYEEPFTDRIGNTATLRHVEYEITKKNKKTILDAVIQVKWNNET